MINGVLYPTCFPINIINYIGLVGMYVVVVGIVPAIDCCRRPRHHQVKCGRRELKSSSHDLLVFDGNSLLRENSLRKEIEF